MGIDDFKYPIMPDRLYTIKDEDGTYEIRGASLILLYRLYGEPRMIDFSTLLDITDTD